MAMQWLGWAPRTPGTGEAFGQALGQIGESASSLADFLSRRKDIAFAQRLAEAAEGRAERALGIDEKRLELATSAEARAGRESVLRDEQHKLEQQQQKFNMKTTQLKILTELAKAVPDLPPNQLFELLSLLEGEDAQKQLGGPALQEVKTEALRRLQHDYERGFPVPPERQIDQFPYPQEPMSSTGAPSPLLSGGMPFAPSPDTLLQRVPQKGLAALVDAIQRGVKEKESKEDEEKRLAARRFELAQQVQAASAGLPPKEGTLSIGGVEFGAKPPKGLPARFTPHQISVAIGQAAKGYIPEWLPGMSPSFTGRAKTAQQWVEAWERYFGDFYPEFYAKAQVEGMLPPHLFGTQSAETTPSSRNIGRVLSGLDAEFERRITQGRRK